MNFKTINFKAGTLALVKETAQGTPVRPSAASDFTAIQSDISLTPAFENLTNEELKNSIIAGKVIIGTEQGSGSFTHYFRAGDAGNPPDYRLAIEAATGTQKLIAGSEQAVAASPTPTVRQFEVADASEYEKGDILLIQKTDGFELRPIKSVTGNLIELAFDLETAPNAGALIGKPITYQLENDSNLIPTLSAWYYLPQTAQLLAGIRVAGLDITADAGQLITGAFALEGTGFYWNPLVVDASNKFLDFDVSATEYNVSVAEKTYRDPHDLAEAIESAMNAAGSGVTFSVTYGNDGKYTIVGDSAFSLLWDTGTNNAATIGDLIGFDTAADTGSGTSFESEDFIDLASGFTPEYDEADPIVAKGSLLLIGDQADNVCLNHSSASFSIGNTNANLLDGCAETAIAGSLISDRELTASVTSYLQPYEAAFFRRLRKGETVQFFYAAGERSGGQPVKNKNFGAYMSHATITSLEIAEQDGNAILNMELAGFAPEDSTQPGFIGFV